MNGLLLAAWIGCQALDGGTTWYALSRPGFREGNPMMRGPHIAYVKVGVNIGALLWHEKKLKPMGRKKILPMVFAIGGCAAGALNLRTLRR